MLETRKFNGESEWKGHQWKIIQNGQFELTVASEIQNDPRVLSFQSIVPQAIKRVQDLFPPSVNTKKVKIALFPEDSYRKDLSLSESVPNWVKVCTRDQKTCYDISFTHTHNKPPSFDRLSPENQREFIHELAHSIHPVFSDQWYKWTPLHIREGVAEVLARILANTQEKLTRSNRYIDKQLRDKLVDPFILDNEGLFARSKAKLNVNPAYLSVTSYVTGLSSYLGNRDIRKGLLELKTIGEEEQNMDQFMQHLSKRTQGDVFYPSWRKNLQLEGINILLKE